MKIIQGKILIYSLFIFLFTGCEEKKQESKAVVTKKESRYKNLLKKYREISFDTLEVSSTGDFENDTNQFKGVPFDHADALLFPEEVAEQHFNEPPGLFACYRFPIDAKRTGLITRTPSTYLPSSIKLFILDQENDTLTDFCELAESFGDAGDVSEKTSWLFRADKKTLKAFTLVEESHYNSAEDETDTTVERWNYLYLLRISGNRHDTISSDSMKLARQFSSLINRKAVPNH